MIDSQRAKQISVKNIEELAAKELKTIDNMINNACNQGRLYVYLNSIYEENKEILRNKGYKVSLELSASSLYKGEVVEKMSKNFEYKISWE